MCESVWLICVGIERIYGALALVFCLLAKRFVSNSDVNILFAVAEKTFLTCCMPHGHHPGERERVALGIYACADNSWQQDISRSCR